MSTKTLVKFRAIIAILLYSLIYSEYLLIYPLKNEISPLIPLITVIGIIILIAILLGIESVISDFEVMKKAFLLSFLYQFLTVLFLIILLLPEVAYTYCSKAVLLALLCIFILCHFILLLMQNKNIMLNDINLNKKCIELERKHNDISGMLYYKYSNFQFKLNIIYILIYSFSSLPIRRFITFLYAVFIIYLYYKMKRSSEISKLHGQKKLFYEMCYQLLVLMVIFIFSKYLSSLVAVIVLAMITLPIRNTISKILRS